MPFTDVSFTTSDGTILRGRHYPAQSDAGPSPLIIMAHGFAGVIELKLAPFAEAFSAAGFAVLVYDHRNFGISDGPIRQEIDPFQQVNDWRDAITFALTLPGIDTNRVGIWGSSYAGGHVLVLGATDHRVKCVVSQVPFVSGSQVSARNVRADMLPMTWGLFAADRAARMQGAAPQMLPVVADNPMQPAALATREAYDWTMRHVAAAPTFQNAITVRSMELAAAYEPGSYAPRVSPTPLLMIIGTRDDVAPPDLALATYAAALEPKKLVLLDAGHFDPYDVQFEAASRAAVAWFSQHLNSN